MMTSEKEWPKVAIIILNWNGWQDTIECLESVYQITYPNYEVIVVDNGSEDDSIEMIRKYCNGELTVESKFVSYINKNKPIDIKEFTKNEIESKKTIKIFFENSYLHKELIIIKNEKNYGFAKGNNIGIEFALNNGAEYIFMLNNDTIVASDFLEFLVGAMEQNDKIGIGGPTCYFYDTPNVVWQSGLKINWWTGEIKNLVTNKIQDVDCVSGCAMIVKNTVFKNISLIDVRFPFGNEDYEFCTRARQNDFKVINVPNSKIWHKVSKSRNKLMRNIEERNALLGNTGDYRLKDKSLFWKICTPRKIQRVSQFIFYFFYYLPLSALLLYRKSGAKATFIKSKVYLRELKGIIK